MDKTEEEVELPPRDEEKSVTEQNDKEKCSKIDAVKKQICKMNYVVKNLENSLVESEQHDKQLVIALKMDNMKNQRLSAQLEEARKENKQILNALQQQCHDNDVSRSSSRSQIDSCSTISMVHLQYKYEELMASHDGLLKVLEARVREIREACNENNEMRDEIENLSAQMAHYERLFKDLKNKYEDLKVRKNNKIMRLKNERNTLKLVHGQLADLLTKQCMEQDKFLLEQLQTTSEPVKALLIAEVRKTNQLQHENAQLKQKLDYLKAQLTFNTGRNVPRMNKKPLLEYF